jgi:hypothetical protein
MNGNTKARLYYSTTGITRLLELATPRYTSQNTTNLTFSAIFVYSFVEIKNKLQLFIRLSDSASLLSLLLDFFRKEVF